MIKQRLYDLIESKHMLWAIGLASFLESTIVPIPLETVLIPLMQKRKDQIWLIALITTIGCLMGALVGYAFGFYLFEMFESTIVNWVASPEQFDQFKARMETDGFWLALIAGVTPVPLQLAMIAAGVTGYSLLMFMLATAIGRVIRYFGLAVLVYFLGDKTEALIKQYKWRAGLLIIIVVLTIWWFTR